MKETNLYNENANYIKDKVSAVVPVYNGELFLPHILDSILAQTYPQIEMILVDDGSSDRTLQIAEAYREAFAVRGTNTTLCVPATGMPRRRLIMGCPM